MAEVVRRLDEVDRRLATKVTRDLYDRDRTDLKEDIAEIRLGVKEMKESFNWGLRVFVAQFLALIVGLLFFLLGQP